MCIYISNQISDRKSIALWMRKERSFWKLVGISEEPGMAQAAPSHVDWKSRMRGTRAPPRAAVEAGGPEGYCCSLWVPSDREEMSVGGGGRGAGTTHQNDWNFPSRFALTTCIELQPLILYPVSKNGIH